MVIMNDDNVWRSYMLIIYDADIYMVSIYVVMSVIVFDDHT